MILESIMANGWELDLKGAQTRKIINDICELFG